MPELREFNLRVELDPERVARLEAAVERFDRASAELRMSTSEVHKAMEGLRNALKVEKVED